MKWNDTCNRFVAFFDIMGFKDSVQRNSHNKIRSKMLTLKHSILAPIEEDFKRYISSKARSRKKPSTPISAIKPVIFSDSILLITNGDKVPDFDELLVNSGWLMHSCFKKGIPIKGAISHGKFTADFNNSIYFGQPLIDAYQLQNELLLYGCIFDHTVENYLRKKKIDDEFDDLKKYHAPLKTGKVNHLLLDWIYISKGYTSDKKHVANFYRTVSGKPRIYVDNTMEYLDFLIKLNHPEKI